MAKKKTAGKKTVAKASRKSSPGKESAAARLRQTWTSTVDAITAAEGDLQRQMKALLKRNKISTEGASAMLKDLSALIGRERKRALKQLETRLGALQVRAKKERKVVGRAVDDAVQSALATFNIPSRQEVQELTRKVDELSRKIDRFKR